MLFETAEIDPWSTEAQTGYRGGVASPLGQPGIARSTGPGSQAAGSTGLLSLRNPLTWFGILAGVTFGLIGFSSTGRVGKARATVTVGRKK